MSLWLCSGRKMIRLTDVLLFDQSAWCTDAWCWCRGHFRFSWRRFVRRRTRCGGSMRRMSMIVQTVNRRSASHVERCVIHVSCYLCHTLAEFCFHCSLSVCLSVCLSVIWTTQKVIGGFSQNLWNR